MSMNTRFQKRIALPIESRQRQLFVEPTLRLMHDGGRSARRLAPRVPIIVALTPSRCQSSSSSVTPPSRSVARRRPPSADKSARGPPLSARRPWPSVARVRVPGPVPRTVPEWCIACWISILHLSRLTSPIRSSAPHMNASTPLLPGQALERERTRAARLSCRRGARVSVHAEQRRAGGSQRHRHLVHRPSLRDGHPRRSVQFTGPSWVRAAIWRRRIVRADRGGAGVWADAAMRARRRPLGPRSGHRCSRCRCSSLWRCWAPGCSRRSALRPPRSNWPSTTGPLECSARRWNSAVVPAGIFQRRGPAPGHAAGDAHRDRGECRSESGLHLRAGFGVAGSAWATGAAQLLGRRGRAGGVRRQEWPLSVSFASDGRAAVASPGGPARAGPAHGRAVPRPISWVSRSSSSCRCASAWSTGRRRRS